MRLLSSWEKIMNQVIAAQHPVNGIFFWVYMVADIVVVVSIILLLWRRSRVKKDK